MSAVESFLATVEDRRVAVSSKLKKDHRAKFGQFFTPTQSAALLASMVPVSASSWRLVDPGAGVGSLTAALVARWLTETEQSTMQVIAYEVDPALVPHLEATLEEAKALARSFGRALLTELRATDFVLEPPAAGEPNVVVMNPPYLKLGVNSPERLALVEDATSIRVTNLYAAFLIRAIRALEPQGTLVAITPRSFANGPYFRDLREELLREAAFRRIHVFESRKKVFADADVLQENLVFAMERSGAAEDVVITASHDALDDITTTVRQPDQIVHPADPHRFIRLPLDEESLAIAERMATMPCALPELGVKVSTGRVVDFRTKPQLRAMPDVDTVPLVYPQNMRDGRMDWPVVTKKPQALFLDDTTAKLLLPNETYVVVKRFSAKEEPRRVAAAVLTPETFGDATEIGIENHLNVFHDALHGIDAQLALGLCAYLNSRFVDEYVRQFNGHTQINATDLRGLRYPTRDQLGDLAKVVADLNSWPDARTIDDMLERIVPPVEQSLMIV